MSRRGAVKVNPVTGKMEKMSEEERLGHRDGCLRVDEKYINAAKDLGLGSNEGMYAHIAGLKRMGAADVPVGSSIESEADEKRRREAAAAPKAKVDVTNTEAVKDAIKTHVTSVGGAKIAGFGPTSRSSTSGIHNHSDSFQHRKGVVNTFGGAKDVSRMSKEEPAKLPPRGDKMPGARVAGISSLDPHAMEGKAKRAAAEAKMRSNSSSAGPRSGGGGGATIAGFTKSGGVAVIKKPGGAPAGGAVHSARPDSHHSSGSSTGYTASTSATAKKTMEAIGGSGKVGGITDASNKDEASVAAARAAFFRKQMADKAEKTAAAVALLKGEEA